MSVISVRLDNEAEKELVMIASRRGIKKSEMVRLLIIRGLDKYTSNTELLNQQTDLLQENISLTRKAIKSSVQSLAFSRRILGHLNEDKIQYALEDARRILAQNGLDE